MSELIFDDQEGRDSDPRRRIDLKRILGDPALRRELMVATIIATQAREGIETTRAQAEAAYDKIQEERRHG